MALIHCPSCGNEVSEKAAQCPHCGTLVREELKKRDITKPQLCPECGRESQYDATICSYCGFPLRSRRGIIFNLLKLRLNDKRRNKKIAGIIGISFAIISLLILTIFLLGSYSPEKNKKLPFSKLEYGMTKEEARAIIGDKFEYTDHIDYDKYSPFYFYGEKGELFLWYDDDGTLECAGCSMSTDFDSRFMKNLNEYIEKEYGEKHKESESLYSVDLDTGGSIGIYLDDEKKTIEIGWTPDEFYDS